MLVIQFQREQKNAVEEMVKKSIEMIIVDLELGIITEQDANEEISVEKLIYKSLK